MTKRELERRIRTLIIEFEKEHCLYVERVNILSSDAEGMLGPNIKFAQDVEVEVFRRPGKLWMED